MKFSFNIGSKIKEVWPMYKSHFGNFLLLTIITILVNVLSQKGDFFIILILKILEVLLSFIWLKSVLELLDQNKFKLFSKETMPTLSHFWNFILTNILSGIIIVGGLILLIIPGLYFASRLIFVTYIAAEKNQSAVKTIKESWGMTKGYNWMLFWKSFVIGLFIILGILGVVIGIFITYPIGMIVMIMLYKEFRKFKSSEVKATPEVILIPQA